MTSRLIEEARKFGQVPIRQKAIECANCGNGGEHCLQEKCRDANVEQRIVEPGDRVLIDVQAVSSIDDIAATDLCLDLEEKDFENCFELNFKKDFDIDLVMLLVDTRDFDLTIDRTIDLDRAGGARTSGVCAEVCSVAPAGLVMVSVSAPIVTAPCPAPSNSAPRTSRTSSRGAVTSKRSGPIDETSRGAARGVTRAAQRIGANEEARGIVAPLMSVGRRDSSAEEEN
ncbi:hypothetical protein MSG28_001545 [Choristoneura fumiferana]|uniref:Uncharacterized protein n=1 Tax=Choristoneura fumiferana TaxID=7141 RepID=A0ACC0KUB9_CHOFU|nr:hypothetical protein MSG28_001545 [Choristoneura fumiferana]